jgi:starch phosphorylase
VEIREEVGEDNIFIFGMKTHEVEELKAKGYDPLTYYNGNADLKNVIDMIATGYSALKNLNSFARLPIHCSITAINIASWQILLPTLPASSKWRKPIAIRKKWTTMSILNVANMGNSLLIARSNSTQTKSGASDLRRLKWIKRGDLLCGNHSTLIRKRW